MYEPTQVVAWDTGTLKYPDPPPYHPSEVYPEYPFGPALGGSPNPIYRAVREMLHALELDTPAYGTAGWNPLGKLVQPGNTVILKPNFVVSEHPQGQPGIEAAVVHGSVLRPLIDYVYVALQGHGRIILADSPIKEVDFQRILDLTGIAAIKDFYDSHAALKVELIDFRDAYVRRNQAGFMVELQPLAGDPEGYTLVDLGPQSMFQDVVNQRRQFRSTAVYYENVMETFHNAEHNLYSVPNTLLQADVVISVAKLKTHRKGGVTLSLKNAVGITNEKRSLPHHRVGSPRHGGDAVADDARWDVQLEDRFRDLMLSHSSGRLALQLVGQPLRSAATLLKPLFRRLSPSQPAEVEGDWYGNDTVWRMALDLNHVLFCADRIGKLTASPQRRYLSVIDGVVAGEGEGPLFPTPKPCGILLLGEHPVLVDVVGTRMMGFDWNKVPMLREAVVRDWPLKPEAGPEDQHLVTNRPEWQHLFNNDTAVYAFEPSRGWKGHIER